MTKRGTPKLLDRQKRLLGLVHALGGVVGNLDFQKLLFPYCNEEDPPSYDFVPYKFRSLLLRVLRGSAEVGRQGSA